MKESCNGSFLTKVLFNMVLPGLMLLALALSLPAFASAAGDAAGDAKLQAMKSDIIACMQPGAAGQKAREAAAKKYNVPLSKINEKAPNHPPASDGGWDFQVAYFMCMVELAGTAGVGYGVWEVRRQMDECWYSTQDYCAHYSNRCDHYTWRQGCLKKAESDCCHQKK